MRRGNDYEICTMTKENSATTQERRFCFQTAGGPLIFHRIYSSKLNRTTRAQPFHKLHTKLHTFVQALPQLRASLKLTIDIMYDYDEMNHEIHAMYEWWTDMVACEKSVSGCVALQQHKHDTWTKSFRSSVLRGNDENQEESKLSLPDTTRAYQDIPRVHNLHYMCRERMLGVSDRL